MKALQIIRAKVRDACFIVLVLCLSPFHWID